jgi:hypothetical protein
MQKGRSESSGLFVLLASIPPSLRGAEGDAAIHSANLERRVLWIAASLRSSQ